MDDISEKLAEILNDPASLNRVREMAENILGSGEKAQENKNPKNEFDINSLFGDGIDPVQIGKIMQVMSRFKSDRDDNRAKLLLALKPHLSTPRQEKVDTAIKLLKLIDLLPFLKDSGMFEF